MLHFPRWKMLLVLLVTLAGVVTALPNLLPPTWRDAAPWLPQKPVNLGLDLRGGAHLLLEVEFDRYLHEQLETLLADLRIALRAENVGYAGLSARNGFVGLTLLRPEEESRARDVIDKINASLEMDHAPNGMLTVRFGERELEKMRRQVIEQSIEIVRRRVDETGTREPIIQRQGDLRIVLQVPGMENPEKLKNLLGQTAKMTFHLVDEGVNPSTLQAGRTPPGDLLLPYQETISGDRAGMLAIKKLAILSGDLLVDANATYEQGQPVVSFRFNSTGARKFGKVTSQHVGERFAIVLDNKIISAPVIREPILGGSGIISGNFTVESAQDLALLLRAGALPAPMKVVEERTVGPSLGMDSIEAGKRASILGIVLVMLFMVLAYGLFGIFSDIALVMNMVFILAALSLFQATLTLPGIAGIVLTIGMAVDANVLIFERMREETRLGKTAMAAADNGFRRAFHTILDSNLTTLIAAALLYYFGSGTIKGFAVTLTIGIVCSMFTAILLTRLMVTLWLKRYRPAALPI